LTTTNAQQGVCCYGGATNKTSALCIYQQQFQRDEQRQVIVLTINISNFIEQRFRADVFQMPPQQQALFVGSKLNRQTSNN